MLSLNLLLPRRCKLGQGDDCDKDRKEDRFGLAHPFEVGPGVEGVVDVEGEHLRLPGGIARCQGKVLVEDFKAAGQGEKGTDRNRRHHRGKNNAFEANPAVCSVDLGRFDQVTVDRLDSGDVDHHHISDILPVRQGNEPPEPVFCIGDDRRIPWQEDSVDDEQPDPAENDSADEVRHEEDRPIDIRPFYPLSKQQSEEKRQDIDGDHGDNGESDVHPKRCDEIHIGEDSLIVAPSDKHAVGDG